MDVFKITLCNCSQSLKIPSPMLVTLLGIVIEMREEHPEKARSPMLLTLLGIVIEMREEQYRYLEVIDYQLFAVNTAEKWIGFYLWV